MDKRIKLNEFKRVLEKAPKYGNYTKKGEDTMPYAFLVEYKDFYNELYYLDGIIRDIADDVRAVLQGIQFREHDLFEWDYWANKFNDVGLNLENLSKRAYELYQDLNRLSDTAWQLGLTANEINKELERE